MNADLDDVPQAESVWVRPMRMADIPYVQRLTARAYGAVDAHQQGSSPTVVTTRPPVAAAAWELRAKHLLITDPGGCWVAEINGEIIGCAVSFNRELMWILATYAVRPGLQGRGIGRQLLEAAIQHGRGCLRGMLASSADPAAARSYRKAGFTLHPFMSLTGMVDRRTIPITDRVRGGSASDIDLMDSIDRRTRGAAHGGDHTHLLDAYHLMVTDRSTGSGYVYVNGDGSPELLAATNRRTAAALLWEAIATAPPDSPITIGRITAANEWAIDVGMAAQLHLGQRGYLGVRRLKPPTPYLPHRALL